MIFIDQDKEISRKDVVAFLVERDGDFCYICGQPFKEGELRTVDHYVPQSYGKANGWTYEQIHDVSNLRLSSQKCNARKGSLLPNPDGSLPDLTPRPRPAERRAIRKDRRQEVCQRCQAGRSLGVDETCSVCGSGPKPERWPRWAKVPPSQCDHSLFWCWLEALEPGLRQPAIFDVLDSEGSLDND